MWSIVTHMGSTESKFAPMQKGGCHSFHTLLGTSFAPLPDKQFSYFKSTMNPRVHILQNYSTSINMDQSLTINSSRQTNPPLNNTCNKKKKKRRRRRKKKKTKIPSRESPPQRQRQLSTASEDSFVIFFDDKNDQSDNETETTEEFGSSDCFIPHKKVRFATGAKLCEVHSMVMWSYAYQAARKGPWEEYARDRGRFKCRVLKTEALIGHVFAAEHRSRIYEERFAEDEFHDTIETCSAVCM